ncbi:MAG: HAMP domain-containing sensor histidine kinase, partial [Candidatus Sungbacteria bacterium]|nr:HAMP domain-containing sensor histidine kinase [Candidatus Sungbacteria bacterium]
VIAPQSVAHANAHIRMSQSSRVKRVLGGEFLDGLDPRDRYESVLTHMSVVGAGKRLLPTGWALLSEWPLSDADAVIRDVRGEVVNVILLSIFFVLVLVPFFVARLLRPIHALEESAVEIEKGNFKKRVEISTHDELEDLGTAFNKMAIGLKRLAELRDEFVFIAAHELRSPVTVVKGYLSMLLEEEASALTAKAKEYVGNIKNANDRLAQLVNDLLEVARSEAGRIAIEVKSVDMAESVSMAVEEIRPLASEKSITLQYDIPRDLPPVMADSSRIKEVIINLVSNAIKYSPQGASVTVSHEVKDKELITHVKDTGYGIGREAQAKLFEKFYRVRTEATINITGTGLGLFIIKELVTKMNGTIWFESEEKKGSTFSFSLPLA